MLVFLHLVFLHNFSNEESLFSMISWWSESSDISEWEPELQEERELEQELEREMDELFDIIVK